MKRGDRTVVFVLATALLLSVLPRLFAPSEEPRWAVIYVGGSERHRFDVRGPLKEIEIVTATGRVVIAVGDGGARFVASDCSDRLCIAQGRLDRVGQSALCLPNAVEIRLEGTEKGADDVDAHSF